MEARGKTSGRRDEDWVCRGTLYNCIFLKVAQIFRGPYLTLGSGGLLNFRGAGQILDFASDDAASANHIADPSYF